MMQEKDDDTKTKENYTYPELKGEKKESRTDLFHNVISVPDACCIKEGYRNTTDTDACFNHITSGSSNFSNYCPLTLHATRRSCSISKTITMLYTHTHTYIHTYTYMYFLCVVLPLKDKLWT